MASAASGDVLDEKNDHLCLAGNSAVQKMLQKEGEWRGRHGHGNSGTDDSAPVRPVSQHAEGGERALLPITRHSRVTVFAMS